MTHTHVHHHHHKHPLAVHHIDAHTMEELAIIHECLHKLHVHRQAHPNATDNSAAHLATQALVHPAHVPTQHTLAPGFGNTVHHGAATAPAGHPAHGLNAFSAPPHVQHPGPAPEEDPFEAMQKAAMAPANVTHNPHLKPDGTHYTAEEVVTFQKELFKSGKLSAPKAREIWAKVGASAKTAPTPEQCGQLMYDLKQVH